MNILRRIVNKLNRMYLFRKNFKIIEREAIVYEDPNYLYQEINNPNPVIIDVGCAGDPDFSRHMIDKYSYSSIGVDPTKKHFASLKNVEEKTDGKFRHLPFAIADVDGILQFNESSEHDSGSLLTSHSNVINDNIKKYEVQAYTIGSLIDYLKVEKIDYLKLDLEGIEYSLLEKVSKSDLKKCDQIFIEFHHHCITEYSIKDTKKHVDKISAWGFQPYTLDNHNYLFVKK